MITILNGLLKFIIALADTSILRCQSKVGQQAFTLITIPRKHSLTNLMVTIR